MSKKETKITPRAAHYDVIKHPVVTEKSQMATAFNKYVFAVDGRANKTQVSEAVAAIFTVKVKGVNILNVKGKTKQFRGKSGKRKDVKRAIVTLAEGQTIDLGIS